NCQCWNSLTTGLRASPEAAFSFRSGGEGSKPLIPFTTSWTYAATNRLLVQAWASFFWQSTMQKNPLPQGVGIFDLATGYFWNGVGGFFGTGVQHGNGIDQPGDIHTQHVSVSYVTGSQAFKAGITTSRALNDVGFIVEPNGVSYTFQGGVPLLLTQWQ